MWYRDPALAQIHVADLARDAAAQRLAQGATSDGGLRPGVRRQVRVATASAVRRTGRAVLAVAEWLDDTCNTEPPAGPIGEAAFRHS